MYSLNIQEFKKTFAHHFGCNDGIRIFFAPGRVNLIGEHTDYNGGYVFPASITLGTWAAVRPRKDGLYRFRSTNFMGHFECHATENVLYKQEDDWANYPKGVLVELMNRVGREDSVRFTGADLLFHGTLPNEAGLSSSASIELVTALSLSTLSGLDISMIEQAKLSQSAENHFIGVNCGILDQFAVAMGKRNQAILLKCDKMKYEYVPFEIEGYKLVITNSNKRRGLADSKYNERRRECEIGLAILQREHQIQTLGDLSYSDWTRIGFMIADEVIRRRVEHVVSENERVIMAKEALEKNRLMDFGELMKESHLSLKENYEVTGIELDTLFEEALKVEGCIGTRMTGAGFGGCTISLVNNEAIGDFQASVSENYKNKTGLTPDFYVCEIGDGAREIV